MDERQEQQTEKIINRQTAISLGLIITALTILGSVTWMFATLTATVNQHTIRIDRLEGMMDKIATKEDLKTLENNIRNYLLK